MTSQESATLKDILIVDDEYPITRALTILFEDAGFSCDTALTGPQALELLGRSSYKVALIDHTMPGMTGPQLCQMIREDPKNEGIHIILMSALQRNTGPSRSSTPGIDEFVVKPFDPKKIVKNLKRIIGR